MGFKRYYADEDSTISNAYNTGLMTRKAELANMGASDILEVFSIYGQASSSSIEKARFLMKFDVSEILADYADIAVYNPSYELHLFNAPHNSTLPRNYYLRLKPVSASWTEGDGLDMEEYTDIGAVNWVSSSLGTTWTNEGGDYLSSYNTTSWVDEGDQNVIFDVTGLVQAWMSGTIDNYGLGVMLDTRYEDGSMSASYYTKKFFGRGTEFFFKRPSILVYYDDSKQDQRSNFFASSSLSSTNNNTIYMYNYYRGQVRDIPGVTGAIYVDLYDTSTGAQIGSTVTGSRLATGTYVATFEADTTASYVNDVWYLGGTQFYTGSIEVSNLAAQTVYSSPEDYVINITNLKQKYQRNEVATLRVYVREKDWQPTMYTVYNPEIESTKIEHMYFRVIRIEDDEEVVPFPSTTNVDQINGFTRLSYDEDGNYFTFDMSYLEGGYTYAFQFLMLDNGRNRMYNEEFRFRVEVDGEYLKNFGFDV